MAASKGLTAAALGLLAALSSAGPAPAASWLEMNFWLSGPRYDGDLPPCEWGLGTIASRFAEKESRYWNSSVSIEQFDRVREIAYRPWSKKLIPRRYCEARVRLSPGHFSRVYYSIGEDTGFAGFTWGVEWCVVGYDRNLAYAPGCRMARP
jgi:hypothetical protein